MVVGGGGLYTEVERMECQGGDYLWEGGGGTTVLFYGIQGDTGAIDVSVDLLLFLFLFQLTIVRQFLASSVRIKTTAMLC